jgi:hypothetical protein
MPLATRTCFIDKLFERLGYEPIPKWKRNRTNKRRQLGGLIKSNKYVSFEQENYKIEEYAVPPSTCKTCKNKIHAFRSSRRQFGKKRTTAEVDCLRFGQNIQGDEGRVGRCALEVSVLEVNDVATDIKNGFLNGLSGKKMKVLKRVEPKTKWERAWDVMWESHCADVKCTRCANVIVYWYELRRVDGEDHLRWIVTPREGTVASITEVNNA